MVERTQEGTWKWILSIILGLVSWLVAGMVSRCSCLLGRPSQNPGMVSKCVNARAHCHLGTWIDEMTAKKTLYRVEMDRKMSLVPAVVAAPNPSVKDEWFPVLCTITPGFLHVDHKVWKQIWFSLWLYSHIHKATWLLAISSLWSNSAFISCHPGPLLPPAKCQMLVKFAFGGKISENPLPH